MTAAAVLQDTALRWSAGLATPEDVVTAAYDALAAGLDGEALGMLAAVSAADGDYDLRLRLPAALAEQGLEYFEPGTGSAREAAARVMAARLLAGEIGAQDLTVLVRTTFGWDFPLTARLTYLDSQYEILGVREPDGTVITAEGLDAQVFAEARRIVSCGP